MNTEQAPDLQMPLPISVNHIDPETNIEYIYTTTEITEESITYIMPPVRGAKQIILAFLWRYYMLKIKDKTNLREDVIQILPLVDSLFDDITLYPSNDPNPDAPKFGYTLIPYSSALLSKQDLNNPTAVPPSEAFKEGLINKMYASRALNLAMAFYLEKMGLATMPIRKTGPDEQEEEPIPLEGNMSMGLHFVGQLLNVEKKFDPSNLDEWQVRTGQKITNKIDRYGIDLSEIQLRVVEAVFEVMSRTRGKGNLPPIDEADIRNELPAINEDGPLPKLYRNVNEIPRLKLGKRELVRLAGMNDSAQSDTERVLQALDFLATTQFCFYYTRLAFDEKGKPVLDPKTQKYKKEEVTAVDTLLKVKSVRDESTKEFMYYEISPSALFLDQKSSYFLLVPFGWREEVRAIVGNKKASSYLYLFLMYLRYQFEHKRQKNANPQLRKKVKYTIERTWVDVAQAIRMPETVYRRNKARALAILEDAYSSAKALGYLSEYSHQGDKDILVLNPEKYPSPKKEIEAEAPTE